MKRRNSLKKAMLTALAALALGSSAAPCSVVPQAADTAAIAALPHAGGTQAADLSKNHRPDFRGNQGNRGRLSIPSLHYAAALGEVAPELSQQQVDKEDAAAWIGWMNDHVPIIADHNYQGFSGLEQTTVGKTKAYVRRADGSVTTYVLDAAYPVTATPDGTQFIDAQGRDALQQYSDGVLMYTCRAADWPYLYVTHWRVG